MGSQRPLGQHGGRHLLLTGHGAGTKQPHAVPWPLWMVLRKDLLEDFIYLRETEIATDIVRESMGGEEGEKTLP